MLPNTGAAAEVATLRQALIEAEKKTAEERTERDRLGAQVGEVQQELQALMKKHESLCDARVIKLQ